DETGGATATDSSGNGNNATIISDPQEPPAMSAYEVILSPGGGSATPADATWLHSYLAADANLTGSGWNINTEGTPGNLGGFSTAGDQDVGGLRTGSSTVISFSVTVPQTGNYQLSVFDGSNASAGDVDGPTNIFARVDGGDPQQIWLPAGYNWVIWNHADTTVHLTAGTQQISLSGGAGTDYQPQGQSGAGAADLGQGGAVTFWTYSAGDGYSDLAFRYHGPGSAQAAVN